MSPQMAGSGDTRPPTQQDAVAVAQAGGTAVEGASSAEQARERSAAAMRTEADNRGIALSDADISRITDGLVGELERRGAFAPPPQAPPPGSEAELRGGSSTAGGPPAAGGEEPQPRKLTPAQRFLGQK